MRQLMATDQIIPKNVAEIVSDGVLCTVCVHELAKHDHTGRRYCEATQSQALQRGCICRLG
jgi:uncharacterized CHY-type Zn-finger protein